MKKNNQSGFSAVEAVLIIVVLGIIGFAGWFVYNSQKSTDKTLSDANKSQAASGTGKSTSATTSKYTEASGLKYDSNDAFYTCWEQDSGNYSVETGICKTGAKTYTVPSAYTDSMIRGSEGGKITSVLPKGGTEALRTVAKDTFKTCIDPTQKPVATVRVFGIANTEENGFIYHAVGCDGGYRQIIASANGTWTSIYKGQDVISCEAIAQYKIPTTIFTNKDDSQPQCYDSAKHEYVNIPNE